MIIYNQAFDLYHCVFRIMNLLNKFDIGQLVEIDRIRIWDFYLLFPDKVYDIRLKKDEDDIRDLRKKYIRKRNNPYEHTPEDRKIFEKLKPYQLSALNCLASYEIINKENLALNRVSIDKKNILEAYIKQIGALPLTQRNLVSLLTSHFYQISLFGKDGLKSRTNLIESKYDA